MISPSLVIARLDDAFGQSVEAYLRDDLSADHRGLLPFIGLMEVGRHSSSDIMRGSDLEGTIECILAGGNPLRRARANGLAIRLGTVAIYYVESIADGANALAGTIKRVQDAIRYKMVPNTYTIAILAVNPPCPGADVLKDLLSPGGRSRGPVLDCAFLLTRQTEEGNWMREETRERVAASMVLAFLTGDLFGPDQHYRSVFALNRTNHIPTVSTMGCARILHPRRRLEVFCSLSLAADLLEEVLLAEEPLPLTALTPLSRDKALKKIEAVIRRYREGARSAVRSALGRFRDEIVDSLSPARVCERPREERPTYLNRVADRVEQKDREAFEEWADRFLEDLSETCAGEISQALNVAFDSHLGGLAMAQSIVKEIDEALEAETILGQRERPRWELESHPGEGLRALLERRPHLWRVLLWTFAAGVFLGHFGSTLPLPIGLAERLMVLPWPQLDLLQRWAMPVLSALAGTIPLLAFYMWRRSRLVREVREYIASCRRDVAEYLDSYLDFAAGQFVVRQRAQILKLSQRLEERKEEWKNLLEELRSRARTLREGLGEHAWDQVLLGPEEFDDQYRKVRGKLPTMRIAASLLKKLQQAADPEGVFSISVSTLKEALKGWCEDQVLRVLDPPDLFQLLDLGEREIWRLWQELERDGAPLLRADGPPKGPKAYILQLVFTADPELRIARLADRLGCRLVASKATEQLSFVSIKHNVDTDQALNGCLSYERKD